MFYHPIWNIKRAFWLVLAASLIAATTSAQQPNCPLKIDQFPDSSELRGFRLGMTIEQAQARIPSVQLARPDQFGIARISINPFYDPKIDKTAFADVRTVSLDFLDGRLVSLWIGFENSFKWQTLETFVGGMSKSLNLPADWPSKRGNRQLTCDGFSVSASMIAGSPSIRISDDSAEQTITDRREAAAAAAEAAEAQVIGDKITKLYYPSDCAAMPRIAPANRIEFKDKDEAEKAGFKLVKDCR